MIFFNKEIIPTVISKPKAHKNIPVPKVDKPKAKSLNIVINPYIVATSPPIVNPTDTPITAHEIPTTIPITAAINPIQIGEPAIDAIQNQVGIFLPESIHSVLRCFL